jgi:hypothetical protein
MTEQELYKPAEQKVGDRSITQKRTEKFGEDR